MYHPEPIPPKVNNTNSDTSLTIRTYTPHPNLYHRKGKRESSQGSGCRANIPPCRCRALKGHRRLQRPSASPRTRSSRSASRSASRSTSRSTSRSANASTSTTSGVSAMSLNLLFTGNPVSREPRSTRFGGLNLPVCDLAYRGPASGRGPNWRCICVCARWDRRGYGRLRSARYGLRALSGVALGTCGGGLRG